VGGEGVAEGVAGGGLGEAGLEDGGADGFLEGGFVEVVGAESVWVPAAAGLNVGRIARLPGFEVKGYQVVLRGRRTKE